jgi:hypothetical protein
LNLKKILLSAFICFHLIVIVVLANGSSFLGRHLAPILLPYANTLGLNATWNFFSPDPAHTMFYRMRIFFEDANGEDLREPEELYFPPEKGQIVVNSSKRRMLYAMRFLTLDPTRLKSILGPWLCRQYPGATRVKMEHFIHEIPGLDAAMAHIDQPLSELLVEKNFISEAMQCESKQ